MEHRAATSLVSGHVGYANLALDNEIAFRPFRDDHTGGSFRLLDIDSGAEVAFGIINFGLRRATNIRWHALAIDKSLRAGSKGQKPCILWFTGLSASGKSTVASLTEKKLHALGKHTYVLDGDNVRHGLCRDLGFTDADRVENLRRVSETAKLLVDAGLIVLVSFISPFRSERAAAREKFSGGEFIEIFVDTPIEVCEDRDPKGLYKKARAGQLKNFTGIDSPYEPPLSAEIVLPGGTAAPEELAERIIETLQQRDMLSPIALNKD
jgi:bifunctional enzyme CysN/CysC